MSVEFANPQIYHMNVIVPKEIFQEHIVTLFPVTFASKRGHNIQANFTMPISKINILDSQDSDYFF